ncbi:uncharacterized protein LOC110843190 isoform X2 [Folsomia candida]|uniref:uncharacterized protein LOC110843190 isoform X2 n=1 Tax=Folsomia candida TaxID=158441 RepID=UPI001604B23C|nr:uncharacterized protein LOC110843190 isoform X2 [Folsomia candida]
MGNDKIKLSPTIAGYSKCSHKTRATVISFIYWVISGIILISPCLSIAYVVLDKDEQFYEAVLDENTSLEFRQKYITFFTSLYNADKSGILITNDWPLINRFIYGSWTYLFAIYWIIQVVLCAKLMQGVEQENFWKMNAWYEGQMGILMASSVASFSVLGSRIISPELFYVYAASRSQKR